MTVLYHGSSAKLEVGDYLSPNPSQAAGGRSVVFATPDPGFALAYTGGKWTDDTMWQGRWGGLKILVEMEEGVFKRIFEGRTGYLYEVSPLGFKPLHKGDEEGEYIRGSRVKILKRHTIRKIPEAIRVQFWRMLTDYQ